MSKESLFEQIILGEIGGKNSAIHAYDQMIWKIRSGFLAIFFGGWGIILKGMIDKEILLNSVYPYILMMIAVSTGIAFGGFIIDRNYVQRKFRVINALNRLMEVLTNFCEEEDKEGKYRIENLCPLLKVAGDSDTKNYNISGYSGAITAGAFIYIIPIVTFAICVFFLLIT